MSEAELESFKKMLRSVLLTSKEGFPAHNVEAEYKLLVGEDIPYRKFGFRSVQDFILQKAPDAAKLARNKAGESVFVGIGTEETKHIEKLVRLQKQSKRKKKHAVTTKRNPMLNHRSTSHFSFRQPRSEISHNTHFRQNQATGGGSSGFVVTREPAAPVVKPLLGFPQNSKSKEVSKLTANVAARTAGFSQKSVDNKMPIFPSTVAKDISNNNNWPEKREIKATLPPRFQNLNQQIRIDTRACGDSNQAHRKSVFDRLGPQVSGDAVVSSSIDPRKVLTSTRSLSETEDVAGSFRQCRLSSSSEMDARNTEKFHSVFRNVNNASSEAPRTDQALLHQRISKLLETHQSGIWLNSLRTVYEKTFKTVAPSDLETVVETWTDAILVENIGFKKMVKSKVSSVFQARKPAKLELNDEWEHDVYVSFVRNAGEVVVRLVGDKHSILLESLEEDYGTRELKQVDSVHEGLICLVANESEVEYEDRGKITKQVEKYYNRVEVISVSDHVIKVEYLDHGGSEEVDRGRLFSMPSASRLPCQAVYCVLEGLEDLKDDENFTELLQRDLPSMSCRARGRRVQDHVPAGKDLFAVTLIGYDDESVTINEQLKIESCGAPVPKLNEAFTASVASVGYNGLVYLHAEGPGLRRLNSLLSAVDWQTLKTLAEDGGNNELDQRGLIMFTGGQWRRVKVLETISKTEVFVQDIDCGDVYIVSTSNLRILSPETHQKLINFPQQAMCCIINKLPENVNLWTADAYLHLSQKLLSKGTKLKAVIIGQNEKQMNVVDLWLPSNKSVADLMTVGHDDLWVKVKPCKVEPLSSGDEVYITDCQDPGNFKGFSKSNFNKVQQMMSDMQNFYAKFSMNELVPKFSSLSLDSLYAVRLSDNDPWHRATIVRIMNRNMISVCFVDFGHYYVIQSINKIRYLPSDFLQLPLVSHEMSLAGVCHDVIKWSEQDTETLRNLILNKTFRVFLSNRTLDKTQSQPVTLIDTSMCDNPFVHQILLMLKLVTPMRSCRKF